MKNLINILAAALALGLTVTPACAAQYTLIDLGTLGGIESRAYGINSQGHVVGYSSDANNDFHGFMWDGTMHDLGIAFGASQKIAYGINSAGQIAGTGYNYGELSGGAFMWLNGVNTFLGNFSARGINESGVVAGYQSVPGTITGTADHACVLANSLLTDLGTLGGINSYGYGINAAGSVVGVSMLSDDATAHACLWSNSLKYDLGTLGGTNSAAYAINDANQIAGCSDTASGLPHACLIVVNGLGQVTSRTDLGALGVGYSYAYGLNNMGQVVGSSGRAVLWQGGQMIDLNGLIQPGSGWVLASANAINDSGWIAGWGLAPDGRPRAFLLEPVGPSIAGAKAAADGTSMDLPSATVTAVFGGFFYIEQDDRANGIRVTYSGAAPAAGQKVSVSGTVQTTGDGERYLQAGAVTPGGTGSIAPMGMTNRAVGGGSTTGQQGVAGGVGVNNIGLLVATTGRVTSIGSGFFYIDDGSAVTDGVGQGIRVAATGLSLPTLNQLVRVCGISSCFKGTIQRLILARNQTDITALD